jgi:hypothetical protein
MEFILECNCENSDGCDLSERIANAIEELEDGYPSIVDFDDVIIVDSKKFFWNGHISDTGYSFEISCGVLKRATDSHLKWIIRRLYFDTELNVRDDIDEYDEACEEDEDGTEEDSDWQREYRNADNLTRATMRLERANAIQYTIEIIESNDINAYALPDGRIQITSAAVNNLSETELAFIIGHEEAHQKKHHYQQRVGAAMAISAGMEQIIEDEKMGNFRKVASVVALGAVAVAAAPLISKAHELEADLDARDRMIEAGYDESSTTDLLDSFGSRQGVYFSTHPTPQFRKKIITR